MKRELLGAVLCGGKSSRMGEDKALLQVQPGKPLLERQISLLATFCSEVAVCVGPKDRHRRATPAGILELCDVEGEEGPMAGLLAALRAARGKPVLVLACDMPFLDASHFVQLLHRRDPECLATCFTASDGLPDPMFCIYEPTALPLLERLFLEGKLSLRRFLRGPEIEHVVPVDAAFLASVNDPKQLDRARKSLEE